MLDTPVISGNVSFYNETPQSAIDPTPIIGMIGVMDDESYVTTQHFKGEGDLILLLGENREELGASEYLRRIHYLRRGPVPKIDLAMEKTYQDLLLKLIRQGLIRSAHDCSEGGLGVALAECCFDQELGATITLRDDIRRDALLFGESQGRYLISIKAEDRERVLKQLAESQLAFQELGKIGGDRLVIHHGEEILLDEAIMDLKKEWQEALSCYIG